MPSVSRVTPGFIIVLAKTELNIYTKDIFDWYIAIKALTMKNCWKRMDQCLFTIKEIVSDIFLPIKGNHYNLKPHNVLFFYLPYEQHIMVVKAYFKKGPKICNIISTELKQESALKTFKESIKLWRPLHWQWPGPILENKSMGTIFQNKDKEMSKKAKYFGQNLGRTVQNSKIFWKTASDCMQ